MHHQDQSIKMVILALLALFCLNIEAQVPDGIDSEQGLSSSDVTMFLHHLENTKEDGMDQPEQSAPKSRTFSDFDHPVKKLDGSLDSSTAPDSKVKRNEARDCPLVTCATGNLANTLAHLSAHNGKPRAPYSTSDPYGPGKK